MLHCLQGAPKGELPFPSLDDTPLAHGASNPSLCSPVLLSLLPAASAHADTGRASFMPQLNSSRGTVTQRTYLVLVQLENLLPVVKEVDPWLLLLLLGRVQLRCALLVQGCGWLVVWLVVGLFLLG